MAICAELLELAKKPMSQTALGKKISVRQATVSKALATGDVGPGVASNLLRSLETTIEALRAKHADVIAGKVPPPWEEWQLLHRKRGTRTDLLEIAEQIDEPPEPGWRPSEALLLAARQISERRYGWLPEATAFAETNCRITVQADAGEIAAIWDEWLRRRPSNEQQQGRDGSPVPETSRSSRPVAR